MTTVPKDEGPTSPLKTEGQDQEVQLVLNGHMNPETPNLERYPKHLYST